MQFSQDVSHPGTHQDEPCLAKVGNQAWAKVWYDLLQYEPVNEINSINS